MRLLDTALADLREGDDGDRVWAQVVSWEVEDFAQVHDLDLADRQTVEMLLAGVDLVLDAVESSARCRSFCLRTNVAALGLGLAYAHEHARR